MVKKLFSVFIILAMCLGIVPASAGASQVPADPDPFDAGPRIRAMGAGPELIDGSLMLEKQASLSAGADCITNSKIFLILNDYEGKYQATYFNLMGESDNTQVWVQANLAWPAGDPRTTPVVTCEQVAYLIGEFDHNIYPTETSFFGPPEPHDGSMAYLPGLLSLPEDYYYDEAGRQIVLVSNVRDENYYDSNYPTYIAGFYSPTFETYFDRNAMTIDAYDWANRIGPDGSRPYLYEGIFAHEYQHLLHDDYDSDEETWVNEGMADLAMVLTDYGESVIGHLEFTAAHPENSLVAWEDQGDLEILADYGQAFLFQFYLMEKFGKSFIQNLFHNQDNGISSVNSSLQSVNIRKDFAKIFRDWRIALLIDSRNPDDGKYWFKDLDFKLDVGTIAEPNPEAYDTPGAPPWGSDYMWITKDTKNLQKFHFNGMDYSMFPTAWTPDGGMLWSGTGDLLDNWAIFAAQGGGTLTFDTIWDLEDYWDFAFVQVSTDGGYTWSSLTDGQGYSVSDYDPNAHPKVIANLPGLTSYITDPVTLTYDLSSYAGMDILLAFRLVTDWATSYGGWWIDNVYVDGNLISDGTDASVFKDLTEIVPIENDFLLTFVAFDKKPPIRRIGENEGLPGQWWSKYEIQTIKLKDATEEAWINLGRSLAWSNSAIMVVSFAAPEGATYYADYKFGFESKKDISTAAAASKAAQPARITNPIYLPIVLH